MNRLFSLSFLFLCSAISVSLYAQTTVPKVEGGKDPIGRVIGEDITVNFTTGVIDPKTLPFDVPFNLIGTVPKNIIKINLTIIEKKYLCNGDDCVTACSSCLVAEAKKQIELLRQDILSKNKKKDESALVEILRKLPYGEVAQYRLMLKALQVESTRGSPEGREILNKKITILDAALKRASRRGCECAECDEPDFTYCYTVCPWSASFISQSKGAADATVNNFRIAVPAMRANRRYQFFFNFERSATEEADELNALRIPLITNALFDQYTFNPLITASQNALQQQLRDTIQKYYRNTNLVDINISGQLIDVVRSADFGSLVITQKVNGDDINGLFAKRDINLSTYNSDVASSVVKWSAITASPFYTRLLGAFQSLTARGDDETTLLEKLNSLSRNHTTMTRIAGGRSTVTTPGAIARLSEAQIPNEVDAYTTNLMSLIAQIRDVNRALTPLQTNESCRHLVLAPAELTLYGELAVKEKDGTIASGEQTALDAMKGRILDFISELKALQALLDDLYTELLTVEDDLENHKEILSDLKTYFILIAEQSFLSSSIDQAAQLTTTADFVTRTSYYVSADVGLAHVFYKNEFSNELQPYFGVNFHLGPINKQKEYRMFNACNTLSSVWKNTSFIVGMTINSLESGRRKNSLPDASILTGIGFRVFEPIRISYGFVWNKIESNNPLDTRTTLKPYQYVSVSFDLDVGKYLRKVGSTIFGDKFNE